MIDMTTQLQWEEDMIFRGVKRFRNQQELASVSRAHETSAGSRLMRSYVLQVSDRIRLYLDGKHPEGRRRNKFAKLLAVLDTDKVAMFAMRQALASVFNAKGTIANTCTEIGRACEDELRFMHFQTEYKEYYDSLIRDFKRKNLTAYNHKRRVLTAKGADQGLIWSSWDEEQLFGVGSLILSLLMEVCDLVERQTIPQGRGRHDVILSPTPACIEWITKHNDITALTSPDRMPCLIPPMDWTSHTDGGFYSPAMRRRTTLIKSRSPSTERSNLYNNADMPKVLSAINSMQRTAWQVNAKVREVMQEVWVKNLECGMPRSEPYEFPVCPLKENQTPGDLVEDSKEAMDFTEWKAVTRELYTMEKERVAKNLALVRTMRLATEMSVHSEFWYVYQCDFRGRVYCTASGLNPQGTDQSKGLVRFANGKAIGAGKDWFLINGANKFGFDKADYAGRIAWVNLNAARFQAVADDPVANRAIWAEADKPYQFLAWCFEYGVMSRMANPEEFVSHLPVGLDGSCNGLQHFSAMLSDSVGGRAVNLMPSAKPEDIYQAVADVCFAKLQVASAAGEAAATNWLAALPNNRFPRALSKKPVMTLPYGSTQQSCTSSIYTWIHETCMDKFEKNTAFRHAMYLSPMLWASISEVVIAARAAMDWIQNCTGILGKARYGLQYTSPLGFPVLQQSMKYESRKIETQIGGRLQVRIATSTTDLDVRKQRQGSSPNLVHHSDACHMMMTINAATEAGIQDFAMIHDDFGTHAADAEKLQTAIRETFVALHTETDILADFKSVHELRSGIVLPDLPTRGTLVLNDVLKSQYFFG